MLSCGSAQSPSGAYESYVCLNAEFFTEHSKKNRNSGQGSKCLDTGCYPDPNRPNNAPSQCPGSLQDVCPAITAGQPYVCFADFVPERCRCTELGGQYDWASNPIITNAQAILYGVAVIVATFSLLMMPHKMPVPFIRQAPPQTWLGVTFVRCL